MVPHKFAVQSTSTKPPSPPDSIASKSSTSVSNNDSPESLRSGERKVAPPNLAVVAAEKRWAENLDALRPCIEDGGYINYSLIPDEDMRNRVKNYVKEQRKMYRRRENNESTSITDERLKLLQEARFPFVFKPYTFKRSTSQSPSTVPCTVVAEAKKATSSLDLLCSITSQSFAESSYIFGNTLTSNADTNEAEEEAEEVEEKEDNKPESPSQP